ncbi:MAG TPA: cbb3-type cytochrome c oxidase subunit 3 [Geomonas sp.]|nr:cbb3-type cytochrome c oxidase subunit 3 [Geomonas sp.]
MNLASVYYLGVTFLLFGIFATIVARTYRPGRKEKGERAKYRMMNDEEAPAQPASAKEDGDAASR